ncbi:MAG: YbhB/YbcL family Raf kinase inhibitor-like protein [Candidatus Lokiarchaeota archaeon]|nr:YbhB/YbcL family Raf kinase inhibitor-like protein [Candidatus Lokiarchaeota archaeon]MBD3202026.1 YbhB/YbcL family Raf kinase inhibitor-like protein [Candidatus Lokiarchaeota archaeon]
MDSDSKAGTWIHWYVVNIPNDINEITRGGPIPGDELENDFGNKEYGGPCPERGEHRYFFTIYALRSEKIVGIDKVNFKEKINDILIESTELMGRYRRINS